MIKIHCVHLCKFQRMNENIIFKIKVISSGWSAGYEEGIFNAC